MGGDKIDEVDDRTSEGQGARVHGADFTVGSLARVFCFNSNFLCETSIHVGNLTISVATLPRSASYTRRMAALTIIDTLGCIYTSQALFVQSLTSHVVTENH
jgi:hypothetical protein